MIAAETKEAEAREAAAKLAPQQETETPSDEEETEATGSKTIVIHFGSRNLRIGLASEAYPHTVPMVIARPSAATFTPVPLLPIRARDDPESTEPLFGQPFEEGVAKLDAILKARLKLAKKRTVPNARELVASYNRRSQPEEILDINDPEQVEWIELGPDRKYATGEAVSSHAAIANVGPQSP
jgi:actin-related protein 8